MHNSFSLKLNGQQNSVCKKKKKKLLKQLCKVQSIDTIELQLTAIWHVHHNTILKYIEIYFISKV